MGINTSFARLLARAREQGTRFGRVATIGRQSLTVPIDELKELSRKLRLEEPDWPRFAVDGGADDFFRHFLGAESVTAIDFSDYQKADIVHDLNQPIPQAMTKQFDTLIDGGTIEHIFDVKQVLENFMNLINDDGSIFINTNSNNLCGHGFYQFSPEFFYRVFHNANGFIVKDVVFIETPFLSVALSRRARCFSVVDPSDIGRRVQLVNSKPIMIFVHARRVSDEKPFLVSPLQSDYKRKWKSKKKGIVANEMHVEEVNPDSAETVVRFDYLTPWQEFVRWLRQKRRKSLRYRGFFTPLKL